jgi:hypothetical protein
MVHEKGGTFRDLFRPFRPRIHIALEYLGLRSPGSLSPSYHMEGFQPFTVARSSPR